MFSNTLKLSVFCTVVMPPDAIGSLTWLMFIMETYAKARKYV